MSYQGMKIFKYKSFYSKTKKEYTRGNKGFVFFARKVFLLIKWKQTITPWSVAQRLLKIVRCFAKMTIGKSGR